MVATNDDLLTELKRITILISRLHNIEAYTSDILTTEEKNKEKDIKKVL